MSRAAAFIRGRDHVLPDDVTELFRDTVAHRLILTDGRETGDPVGDVLASVRAPPAEVTAVAARRVGYGLALAAALLFQILDVGYLAHFLLWTVLALLALPLGWAALWLRSACAVVAMTYPLLLPAFLADHLPRWPDFLLLLTCWCAMFLTSILSRKKRAARARLTLAALPAVGCVLALLTLAIPQERYVYPQWAEEAKGVLLSGDLSFSLPDFVANGIQVGGSSSRVDLAAAGPLSLSSRTMLRVETDVTGRIYLRGRSAGVYTRTS